MKFRAGGRNAKEGEETEIDREGDRRGGRQTHRGRKGESGGRGYRKVEFCREKETGGLIV